MLIFISAGEPSGDLHGANFIRAMKAQRPDVEFVGFGGERMAAAGCRLLYPLCELSVMGLWRVLINLHLFYRVLSLATRCFKEERPDAVVLIDYPGLHWWVARRAHHQGLPVFYFVPPQIWAWASWRVKKMQRYVDHVLCALPFEEAWYHDRGVPATYIGHPYFDAVRQRELDPEFLAQQRGRPGRIVGLLPGSRGQEVAYNFPTLRRTAELVLQDVPEARFLVACFKREHQERIDAQLQGLDLPIETCVGRTAEIIHLAEACAAVSGSVSLEMLHYGTPAVMTYRMSRVMYEVARQLLKVKSMTLVNMLANKTLYPEYASPQCDAPKLAGHITGWLTDPAARAALVGELRQLSEEVGQPGACERGAKFVLEAIPTAPRLAVGRAA
jgi:lipid-A-disaccharide synthase